jgi:hypothetical protein
MSKRPSDGEDTPKSRLKQGAGLRDDGGQQGKHVRKDTLPIQEPPRTYLQLGPSSSTSQADNLSSTIVGAQWKPYESLSSDQQVLKCISWGDRNEGRADLLPVLLRRIARQAGHEISIKRAMDLLIHDESLQKNLITGWELGSFDDIRRRYGEYHLFIPHEQSRMTCFRLRFYAKYTARSRLTHGCG